MDSDYDGDSESDSDSVEEVHIKRYFNQDLEQAIKQAKALRDSHCGIKPHPGYYKLCDPKRESLRHKVYQGKHWDVAVDNRLQRATRRLTLHAVDRAVFEEQQRQVKHEKDIAQRAKRLLSPINKELHDIVNFSQKLMQVEEASTRNQQLKVKDNVQLELLRLKHLEMVAKETEAERQRQIKLLEGMMSDANRSPSIEDLVESMATTHQKRASIHIDLEEAFTKYVEEEKSLNEDYQVALMELLDESLIKVCLMFDRDHTRKLFENEKKETVTELRSISNDKLRRESIRNLKCVLVDMKQVFIQVQKEEEEQDRRYREQVMEFKTAVQEDLIRRMAAKWAEKACAFERARRIQESESQIFERDQYKETMKLQVSRVQRQMILQKFNGKWLNHPGSYTENHRQSEQDESDQDKKLRQVRMLSRKPSCVIRGDED